MINGINTSGVVSQKYDTAKKQGSSKASDMPDSEGMDQGCILELGKKTDNVSATYKKPAASKASVEDADKDKSQKTSLNTDEINRLWDEANRATQNLRDLVEKLLKSQGKSFKKVLDGSEELIVDDSTRAAAQQAISEDGECGVKAVSDRIVSFAKAISNDNPEMYDKLMQAIDEGFTQAEKAFGGQLPDICQKTHEEIGRKMQEWKNSKATEENTKVTDENSDYSSNEK